MRRDGKVAIVTGASTGIGQASAKALHQAGFRVFGNSRRAERVVEAATTTSPRRRYTSGKMVRQVSVLHRSSPNECSTKAFASRWDCRRNGAG
jgi:NADP-dependent 3-hydroxy acid dehydrogenase YdfG